MANENHRKKTETWISTHKRKRIMKNFKTNSTRTCCLRYQCSTRTLLENNLIMLARHSLFREDFFGN